MIIYALMLYAKALVFLKLGVRRSQHEQTRQQLLWQKINGRENEKTHTRFSANPSSFFGLDALVSAVTPPNATIITPENLNEWWKRTAVPIVCEGLSVKVSNVLYSFISSILWFWFRRTFPFWNRVAPYNHNRVSIWNIEVLHMLILR